MTDTERKKTMRPALRLSLVIAAIAVVFQVVQIPLDGDFFRRSAFWILLVAYVILVVAFFKRRRPSS